LWNILWKWPDGRNCNQWAYC